MQRKHVPEIITERKEKDVLPPRLSPMRMVPRGGIITDL